MKIDLKIFHSKIAHRIFMLSEMVGRIHDVEDPIGGPMIDFIDTAREIDKYLEDGFEKILELTK